MPSPQHLHLAGLPIFLLQKFKILFVILLPLFFVAFKKQSTLFWLLIATGIVLTLQISLIYWFTTYQITPAEIKINSGLWIKKARVIPYSRIQSIHQSQWFFYKPLHLVHLRIDTANTEENQAEANLFAIPEQRLTLIQHYQKQNPKFNASVHEPQKQQKQNHANYTAVKTTVPPSDYQLNLKQLFLFSFTETSVIVSTLATISILVTLLPENIRNQINRDQNDVITIIFLTAIILMLAFSVAMAKNLLRFYHFQVRRQHQNLQIEYGLFERQTQTITIGKIQSVEIQQNLLQRLFKLSRVSIAIAGGQDSQDDAATAKSALLPIIRQDQVLTTLQRILPEQDWTIPAFHYPTAQSHQLHWYFWRSSLLILLPVSALTAYFALAWVWLPILLLVIALSSQSLRQKRQAYVLYNQDTLCLQTIHLLTEKQMIIRRKHIQVLTIKTSKWLAPKQYGHLELSALAGSSFSITRLRFIPLSAAKELVTFYRQSRR